MLTLSNRTPRMEIGGREAQEIAFIIKLSWFHCRKLVTVDSGASPLPLLSRRDG